MADQLDNSAPFDEEQGTRIERKPTGAGAEATEGTQGEPAGESHTHRSAYGGDGGKPKRPNEPRDFPRSRR